MRQRYAKIDATQDRVIIGECSDLNDEFFKNAVNLEIIAMAKDLIQTPTLSLDLSNCIKLKTIEVCLYELTNPKNTKINLVKADNSDKLELKDLYSGNILNVNYIPNNPLIIDRSCIGLEDINIIPPSDSGSNLEIKLEDIVTNKDFLYVAFKDKDITIDRSFYELPPIKVNLVEAKDKYVMVDLNVNLFKDILNLETKEITCHYAKIIEYPFESPIFKDNEDTVNYEAAIITKNRHDLYPLKILIK